MRRAGLVGRTVTLKVRYGDFSTRTRSRTSQVPLSEGTAIAALASLMLSEVDVSPGVRLLGVGVSNLAPAESGAAEQMTFDLDSPQGHGSSRQSAPRAGREEAAAAVEAIRGRYGRAAVGPAVLLGPGGVRIKRPGDTQWGPAP
jgi:DNA polymerase-4